MTIPELLVKAQFVMVTSQREEDTGQQRDVEGVQAVADVETALRKWGRYKLVYRKEDADLIVSVRRAASAILRMGGSFGGDSRGDRRVGTTVGGEAATPGDHLAVYDAHIGTNAPALWRKAQKNGLARPDMPLVKLLQEEVEGASGKTP